MLLNDAAAFSYTLTARPGVSINNGLTNDSKTMFQILTSGHMINAHGGNYSNILQNWDDISDAGGYWQFEKVPSVPVSISDALYASVGFPFAVQVPAESGVKAYYATAAADGELPLSEIADGIIPAYTGAILAATAKRTGFEENANYMLGVDSDSEVKFLQATITTVPANKAYLPAANVTNGRSAPDLSHLREVGSPQVFNVIFFIMSGQFEVIRAALFIGSKWGVSPAAGSVAGLVLTYSATCEIPLRHPGRRAVEPPPRSTPVRLPRHNGKNHPTFFPLSTALPYICTDIIIPNKNTTPCST